MKRRTIWLPDDHDESLRTEARTRDIAVSELIRRILDQHRANPRRETK